MLLYKTLRIQLLGLVQLILLLYRLSVGLEAEAEHRALAGAEAEARTLG